MIDYAYYSMTFYSFSSDCKAIKDHGYRCKNGGESSVAVNNDIILSLSNKNFQR